MWPGSCAYCGKQFDPSDDIETVYGEKFDRRFHKPCYEAVLEKERKEHAWWQRYGTAPPPAHLITDTGMGNRHTRRLSVSRKGRKRLEREGK